MIRLWSNFNNSFAWLLELEFPNLAIIDNYIPKIDFADKQLYLCRFSIEWHSL